MAFSNVDLHIRKGCAEEMRSMFLQQLRELGWSDPVPVIPDARITITAVNSDTGLCLQFGNVARVYADLLKMQVFHERASIQTGVLVVPTSATAKVMGSNLANFTRLTGELAHYRNIITLPILVLGVGKD